MLFDKFINREPLDHKMLGDLALKLGKYDKALKHYKKQEYNYFNQDYSVSDEEEDIGGAYFIEEIYEKIIEIYLHEKDYENAIKYCEKQIELDEYKEINKGDSVIQLAEVYELSGEKNKAIDILEDLLKYELGEIDLDPDDDYPKKMYMATCYKLIDILKDTDKNQSQKYMDLAMDMYHKNIQVNLGVEMAGILELQSDFYKKDLQDKQLTRQNLSVDDLKTVEHICRNCVLASGIYLEENKEEKARSSILEGIQIYEKFNLDNFKLHFDLRYQLAYVDSNTYGNYISDENTYNDYFKAYEILKENNFFDEYKKNIILDELAHYCDCEQFELSEQYRNECDYYYIAEYNVENSKKWIVSFVSEYEEAGRRYENCNKYDMAIKCYKKALHNLSGCGIFTEEFYEEELYLDTWDRFYISYSKYTGLCSNIARVYDSKGEYDEAIKYLNMEIDCINKYRDSSDFQSDKYYGFFSIYESIANMLNKKSDFENSIKYYLLLIGAFNSPNLDNEISNEYDDIEYPLKLFEEDKINEYILSEKFNINLNNEYMNHMKSLFEELLKVAENTGNQQIIEFCKQKLYLIKDTPFDI